MPQLRAKFCRSGMNDEEQDLVFPRGQTGSVREGADFSRLFSLIRISDHVLIKHIQLLLRTNNMPN